MVSQGKEDIFDDRQLAPIGGIYASGLQAWPSYPQQTRIASANVWAQLRWPRSKGSMTSKAETAATGGTAAV
jgi:hypothetical protein